MQKILSVAEFQRHVDDYVTERGWKKYHKPKDIAISIAIESSELLELFQWKPDPLETGKLDKGLKARIGEELADIVIYSACMANALDIDLSEVLLDKIKKNRRKYPVEKVAKAKDWDEVRSVRTKPSEKNGDD
jgi:NTP pyrophosphatase (non-canonical NTP hydrolase)